MLTIDEIALSLPAGFEGRAERIARLLGDELARLRLAPGTHLRLSHLALPPLAVAADASDADVASSIAGSIHAHILPPGAR